MDSRYEQLHDTHAVLNPPRIESRPTSVAPLVDLGSSGNSNLSSNRERHDNGSGMDRVEPRFEYYGNGKPRLPLPLLRNSINLNDFLLRFEDRMDLLNCNDVERVAYLEECVVGSEVEPWIRQYLYEHGRKCSWSALLITLRDEFSSPYDRENARKAMEERKMKHDETVRAYIVAKSELICRYDHRMPQVDQIRIIKEGLPTLFRLKTLGFHFDTVKELTKFMVELEGELASLSGDKILPQWDVPKVKFHEPNVSAVRNSRRDADKFDRFEEKLDQLVDLLAKLPLTDRKSRTRERSFSRDSNHSFRRDGTPYRGYSNRSRDSSGDDTHRGRRSVRDNSYDRSQRLSRDRTRASSSHRRDNSDNSRNSSYYGGNYSRSQCDSPNRRRDSSRSRRDPSNSRPSRDSSDHRREFSGERRESSRYRDSSGSRWKSSDSRDYSHTHRDSSRSKSGSKNANR